MGLVGCSSKAMQGSLDTFKFGMKGRQDAVVSREYVDKLPYASILVKIGLAQRSLLVLGHIDGQNLHWMSADRSVIITNRGRISKTVGFPSNVIYTKDHYYSLYDALSDYKAELSRSSTQTKLMPLRYKEDKVYSRMIDVTPENYYSTEIQGRLKFIEETKIEILEKLHSALVFEEYCESSTLDWRFTNTYWVDPDTWFIWKSIQHFTPSLKPAEIQVTKPYRNPYT